MRSPRPKASDPPAHTERPKHRSALRLYLGDHYYHLKRHGSWAAASIRGVPYAKVRRAIDLPHIHFFHTTPTLRKLKDVDMWLQHNKVTNLRLAVEKLNHTVVYPGETFSFWRLVGRPTKAKGYLPGMVLQNGGFRAGTGGGLCQLSNLLYWMTLHTPMTVTERHRHGYDVFPDSGRTLPFGSGATCCYNYLDLCIYNDSPHPFQLRLEVSRESLSGSWRSDCPPSQVYQVYESHHRMQAEYWGGYTRHNVLRRRTLDLEGNETADEALVENHAVMMYAPYLEPPKQP